MALNTLLNLGTITNLQLSNGRHYEVFATYALGPIIKHRDLLDGAIVVLYSADAWNSAHGMGWDGHAIET